MAEKKAKYYKVRVKVYKKNEYDEVCVVKYKPVFYNILVVAKDATQSAKLAKDRIKSAFDILVEIQIIKNTNLLINATEVADEFKKSIKN